jgi:hypothetical protein
MSIEPKVAVETANQRPRRTRRRFSFFRLPEASDAANILSAHLYKHMHIFAFLVLASEFRNTPDEAVLHPLHDEAVRCQQAEHATLSHGLQGSNPGIELLRR